MMHETRISARWIFRVLTAVLVAALIQGAVLAAGPEETPPGPFFQVGPWPEAERLFRERSDWLGGDGATTVALGGRRVLWLFGDSFIPLHPQEPRDRRSAILVRNSVAIQTGLNPARASIDFFWSQDAGGPRSFFPDDPPFWYWPGGGLVLEGRLVVFLMKIGPRNNALGFEIRGAALALVNRPDGRPDSWRMKILPLPDNPWGILVGGAGILDLDGWVYVFGVGPAPRREVFLFRWTGKDLMEGRVAEMTWWAGPERGWAGAGPAPLPPAPLFRGGQNEGSVFLDSRFRSFFQIQTQGFGQADLVFRQSPDLVGPWPLKAEFLYRPLETPRPGLLVYAAKAHPELIGSDLVLTYVVNSLDAEAVLGDLNLYYPRFLRVTRESKPVEAR